MRDNVVDHLEALQTLTASRDEVYHERNMLVAFLTTCYGAHLMRHPETEPWEADWRWIVCVHTPCGQMTWHIHDSELPLFMHVPSSRPDNDWDGHTTAEKYERLAALTTFRMSGAPMLYEEPF
jgi:hypothetical protein